MKIVNRKKFIKMPIGTVFSKLPNKNSESSGDFFMKESDGDFLKNDFIEIPLCGTSVIPYIDTEDFISKINNMIDFEESYPADFLNNSLRNGVFNNDEHYLIYEDEDIEKLIDKLKGKT